MFKRYGGEIEKKNLGLAQFVEIRGLSILLGVPAILICAAFNVNSFPPLVFAVVMYFLFGFLGEASVRLGFKAVCIICFISMVWLFSLSQPFYIELLVGFVFHCIIVWNAYFLYKRVKS